MSAVSRGVVYSLIAVVCVLLVGIMALMGVAYNRHRRLEDTTIDLRRSISQQAGQIKTLQKRLENCDTVQNTTPVDTAWRIGTTPDSASVVSQISRKRVGSH